MYRAVFPLKQPTNSYMKVTLWKVKNALFNTDAHFKQLLVSV